MDIKRFFKETTGGFILKNFILAGVILVALVWVALLGIDFYTHHGESEVMPDLRGTYVEEAQVVLARKGLHPQVVDSVYMRNKKLGTIIDQIPPPNSTVKRNRTIFLVINSRQVRQVPMPNINDVSFRQADAILKSIGLSVGSVEYTPSEYKDLVTDVKFRGRSILPGTRIPEGSSVVLVVGSGLGESGMEVPPLKGMQLEEGRQVVISSSFVIGAINYDVPPSGNESDYVIYRQRPTAGSLIPAGSRVDVWLSKDKSMLDKVFEEDSTSNQNDEQFF